MAVLITGGARSGKSAFAESYAGMLSSRGYYLATLQPQDEEMQRRVRLHQKQRASGKVDWVTLACPLELTEQLQMLAEQISAKIKLQLSPSVVLVDCLTLWLTNQLLLLSPDGAWNAALQAQLEERVEAFIAAVAAYPFPLLLVTNEVGSGIVPAYPLGRRFRDEAGRLNQRLGAVCQEVFLVTAGIPVELKALAFKGHL